jgi:hypothetical protein
MIERPDRYPTFPDYLYQAASIKPNFFWRMQRIEGKEHEFAAFLYIQWMNLIKICRLIKVGERYQMELVKK